MPSTYGTSYFVSKAAAMRYYKPYHYEDLARAVNAKIRGGEIHIGRPKYDPKKGERLVLLDGGKRYGIQKSNPNVRVASKSAIPSKFVSAKVRRVGGKVQILLNK